MIQMHMQMQMQILLLMILLMMDRRADGQMSIKEVAEGDIDAAAYAAEYADADDTFEEQMSR